MVRRRDSRLPVSGLGPAAVALVVVAFASADGLSRAVAVAASTDALTTATSSRPNLVLILTDDQDLRLDSMSVMPRTRELLAGRGATFTNAFVPLSLCCPSRSTILTGLYPHNHRVLHNQAPVGGFQKFLDLGTEERTVAVALHAAGYRTALLGKYLNGYPQSDDLLHVPPGWDEWGVPVDGNPYGELRYSLNENGKAVVYGARPADYLTDVLAAKAVDFVGASAESTQPFFLYLALYAPHKPSTPAPRHAGMFLERRAPRPASFDEPDVRDKPARIRALPRLSAAAKREIDVLYRKRLQSLQAVDEAVAKVVAALAANGQLERTYLFFTSDNGYHMGEHRMPPGKYTPYEEDVHVPLLVRGPGVPEGITIGALASSVDLAPTFAELAGATLSAEPDGRSLVPLWQGAPPADWRRVVLLEQFDFNAEDDPPDDVLEPPEPGDKAGNLEYPSHLGLRLPEAKYVEYGNGEVELYDLRHDPRELQNLARRTAPARLAELAQRAQALGACAGESCRQLEALPPP